MFPLRARATVARGKRKGYTEATIEFCRSAEKRPVGVLCEFDIYNGKEVQDMTERRGEEREY